MSIHGVTFDYQSPTAKDHGRLFQGILEDGVLKGCAISFTGTEVTIGTGYMIVAGRLLQVTAAETITINSSDAYARIMVQVDLSGTATTEEFAQVEVLADYASSLNGFSSPTQEDVNATGTVYQFEFAKLKLTSGNVTAISWQAPESEVCAPSRVKIGDTIYTLRTGSSGAAGYITIVT